jgi:hypothetical protein
MRPPSRPPKAKSKGLNFMLLDGAGGNARRFQVTSRHVALAVAIWIVSMLLFAYLGFQLG